MNPSLFSPGTLVRARGREWIVLGGSDANVLRLRPVTGSEEDATLIHVSLEPDGVGEAAFPPPNALQRSSHDGALLLRDALLLSLRRGAGPFRSFGQIAVEPRAYQLVPLLMALKQPTVRLLIADDVGIGKTIEAALIAREMLDRGDIARLAVLVPPHLVDQWVAELAQRVHIRSVPVTATSAARLERELPPSESIFSAHPFTVVSLDYIKNERRRSEFLRACPELVIVDEAHTCAATTSGRHQRYALLKDLSQDTTRHLVMLTATPHSGDEDAFYRLLGLLDRQFETLPQLEGPQREALRERLAQHFVQRRRPDIDDWKEKNLFPKRETKELTYQLSGAWEQFFQDVLDYCHQVVQSAQGDTRRERLNFWGTLALLRCASSSPAAAVQALRTRAGLPDLDFDSDLQTRVFDGDFDSLGDDDDEPPVATDDPALDALISQAEALAGTKGDPKLKLLADHLSELLEAGFNPVVFCRYISTAHYLGRMLQNRWKGITVEVITGQQNADERKERVDALADAERRLLIATDCLSEGINLQDAFDSVVHYDLSWNPTRHEQREGRVDRFGQKQPVVRATLLYGANNPVDGAVLEVILRKASKIREELGVPVPIPDDGNTLSQALLKAVLMRQRTKEVKKQLAFDFMTLPAAKDLDARWADAAEKAKRNRTVFAQRRLKPEEVLPEWHKTLAAVGGNQQVHRFVQRATARLGSGLSPLRRGYTLPLSPLPEEVKERLESEGLAGTLAIDFTYPCWTKCKPIARSHPLVSVLAESLLARTLAQTEDGIPDPAVLGRTGCWIAEGIPAKTTVALLRLRHQLTYQRAGSTHTLLVEEAGALAWGGTGAPLCEGDEALAFLEPPPIGDPPPHVRERMAQQALEWLDGRTAEISQYAERRAQNLLADHRRVREASDARGSYAVRCLLPADIIGVFVLLPKVA